MRNAQGPADVTVGDEVLLRTPEVRGERREKAVRPGRHGDFGDAREEAVYSVDLRTWESDRYYLDKKLDDCKTLIDALLVDVADWNPATLSIVAESIVRVSHRRRLTS